MGRRPSATARVSSAAFFAQISPPWQQSIGQANAGCVPASMQAKGAMEAEASGIGRTPVSLLHKAKRMSIKKEVTVYNKRQQISALVQKTFSLPFIMVFFLRLRKSKAWNRRCCA